MMIPMQDLEKNVNGCIILINQFNKALNEEGVKVSSTYSPFTFNIPCYNTLFMSVVDLGLQFVDMQQKVDEVKNEDNGISYVIN